METLIIIIFNLTLIVIFVWVTWQIYIIFQGAFIAVTSEKRIKDVLKIANIKKGDRAIDLGSGDGRVLVALAKKGAIVTGIEIDPLLVRRSKKLINKSGYGESIKVKRGNLWKEDISEYDVIFVYGIGHIMDKLEKKIVKDAKEDARIISVYFKFPNLKPVGKSGNVYLYKKGR